MRFSWPTNAACSRTARLKDCAAQLAFWKLSQVSLVWICVVMVTAALFVWALRQLPRYPPQIYNGLSLPVFKYHFVFQLDFKSDRYTLYKRCTSNKRMYVLSAEGFLQACRETRSPPALSNVHSLSEVTWSADSSPVTC